MSACVGRWRNRRGVVPRYWNGERNAARAMRGIALGSLGRTAACVACGVLEVLALLFGFAGMVAFLAVLCA